MNQRPATIYDQPLAGLLPDPEGPRFYGNVDNRLEVNLGHAQHHVAVAVPTELFTFMLEVAKVPVETRVSLAIDHVGGYYLFSLFTGDALYDLWVYTQNSLPPWLLSQTYRLIRR